MKLTVSILIFFILIIPVVVIGQSSDGGLVVCGRFGQKMCTFADFFTQLNKVINFLIFYLATPLAVLGIGWGGVQMLIGAASGNSGQIGEGKKRVGNVIWGFIFALGAYLIVKTIIWALAGDGGTGAYLKSLFN